MISHIQQKKTKSLACSEVKLLHEVVLDLLQHIQAVLDLQVNLRTLEMVLKHSPYPKNLGFKKSKSLAFSEAKLLYEVLLDLLQSVQAVHDLQVNLRPLELVPNDSPYPKTWGLKKNHVPSLLGSQVTPRSCP